MTIEGIVALFHLVNPHPFVTVDVKDGNGRARNRGGGPDTVYKPALDGQRLLVAVKAEESDVPPLRVILNWPESSPNLFNF